jgi:hypothetical protein
MSYQSIHNNSNAKDRRPARKPDPADIDERIKALEAKVRDVEAVQEEVAARIRAAVIESRQPGRQPRRKDLTLTNVDPPCDVMRHPRSAMEGCHETAVKGGLFLRHPALRHPALDVHLLACSTGTRALRIGAVPRPGHASHPSVGATPPTPPCGHGVSKLSLSQLTRTAGISSPINVIAAVGATPPTPPWGPRLPQLWCLR